MLAWLICATAQGAHHIENTRNAKGRGLSSPAFGRGFPLRCKLPELQRSVKSLRRRRRGGGIRNPHHRRAISSLPARALI